MTNTRLAIGAVTATHARRASNRAATTATSHATPWHCIDHLTDRRTSEHLAVRYCIAATAHSRYRETWHISRGPHAPGQSRSRRCARRCDSMVPLGSDHE